MLVMTLLLMVITYYPGLRGDFLIDDWSNLPRLAIFNVFDYFLSIDLYLTSHMADLTIHTIVPLDEQRKDLEFTLLEPARAVRLRQHSK